MGKCKDCIYWSQYKTGKHSGSCRRYCPVVIDDSQIGVWPRTIANLGCHEFHSGNEPDDTVEAPASVPSTDRV